MGSPINWGVRDGDIALIQNPLYLKYASTTFANITASDVKTDIKAALASNESASVIAYLSWLLRVLALVA
jgi:hypothetical protein